MIPSNMTEEEAIKQVRADIERGLINIEDIRILLNMFEEIMQQHVRILDGYTE